jgi:serine protease AprX
MKIYKIIFPITLFIIISGFSYNEISGDQKENNHNKNYVQAMGNASEDDSLLVWIFFKDKPLRFQNQVATYISERSLSRRRLRNAVLSDDNDVPVPDQYLQLLTANGFRVKNISRWMNAVSGKAIKRELNIIGQLPFVDHIDIVRTVQGNRYHPGIPENMIPNQNAGIFTSTSYDSAFYGQSYRQITLINVPPVHSAGYFGQGVIVAVFDAGFNNLQHESFDSLQIIATRDFVNGDSSVADDPGQLGSGTHGTNVLSIIAGYKPGQLIGPAYRSKYLLAKTENTLSEHPIEEDNWIAALEWAESYGADVVSSSVGYVEFDSSGNNRYDSSAYNWTWMTGNSTRITKAANIAADKGMIIVNCAGNENDNSQHNTLNAPADGNKVIAVGAVDYQNQRASFSSVGPTTAGRIKPDVMAMGIGVSYASASSINQYSYGNGTSFSCPMVAGVCALILSAHPEVTVDKMLQALHKTSDRANHPDNKYGYGLVNALKLLNYFNDSVPSTRPVLYQNSPNPFHQFTKIKFKLFKEEKVKITIYNVLGQEIRKIVNQTFPAGLHETITWNGTNQVGRKVSSGIYIYRVETSSWNKCGKLIYLRNG